MKRKKLFAVLGSICLVLVLAALPFMAACAEPAPPPAPAPAPAPAPTPAPAPAPAPELKPQIWKLHHVSSPVHHFAVFCYPWLADEIEKATDGKIKVEIFGAQSLMKLREAPEGVTTGRADIAFIVTSAHAGIFPLLSLAELPFAWDTNLDATLVVKKMYEGGYLDRFLYDDTKTIALHPVSIEEVYSRKPVRRIGDLKGMRIRTAGGLCTDMIEAIGASPISIPTPEVYMALSRGVIDGAMMEPANAWKRKIFEPCKYCLDIRMFTPVLATVMNKDVWDALPKDTQAALDEVFDEFWWRFAGVFRVSDIYDKQVIEPEYNVKQTYFTAEEVQQLKDMGQVVWDNYVDIAVSKGANRAAAERAYAAFVDIMERCGLRGIDMALTH